MTSVANPFYERRAKSTGSRIGVSKRRAESAFAKLTPLAGAPEVKWKLFVFLPNKRTYFGDVSNGLVLDGSIFVSAKLVDRFNDAELMAFLAHDIGEVLHYRRPLMSMPMGDPWTSYKYIGAGAPFDKRAEIEANYTAASYLVRLGIPPDALFDALVKLDAMISPQMEYASVMRMSAACFGKLLDAGMVPELTTAAEPSSTSSIRSSAH